MTTKTDLARDHFNLRATAWETANLPIKITGGDGIVRPKPEFRLDVVDEIMRGLSTSRQNAGTYFSRIFKEQNGGAPPKKRSRPTGPFKKKQGRGPFSATAKARLTAQKKSAEKKLLKDNEWLNPKKRSGSHSRDIDEQDMGTGFLENLDITPDGDIQAPIKTIDRPMALYLGNEAMELLKVLEEYHGLDISRSKSRYEDGFYQMDIRFSVKDSDGNARTPEAQDFIDYEASHGIPGKFLFKEFEVVGINSKVDGATQCIIGWKRRATKNKVLFLRDGKRYVCKIDTMKRYLRRAGLIDG